MPGFDARAGAAEVVAAWARRRGAELSDGGVYWQTNGPRFETPAEIRLIAAHADVVGMTIASECIVAGELGLAYAAVCVVDNLANGIGREPLSVEELEAARAATPPRLRDGLDAVLPELAGEPGDPAPLSAWSAPSSTARWSALRCEGGKIAALGPDVAPEPGDDVDRRRRARRWSAPLVNGHTHAAMTLFRGYGGDLPLMRWLREKVWPVEANLDAEDVYWGARLACLEMIRTGPPASGTCTGIRRRRRGAVEDAGLRATIGGPLLDVNGDTRTTRGRRS